MLITYNTILKAENNPSCSPYKELILEKIIKFNSTCLHFYQSVM